MTKLQSHLDRQTVISQVYHHLVNEFIEGNIPSLCAEDIKDITDSVYSHHNITIEHITEFYTLNSIKELQEQYGYTFVYLKLGYIK